MAVDLDHFVVPSRNRVAAAKFLGELLGVPWAESGVGPFSPVYINEGLTLDFDETTESFPILHFCFRVDQSKFDAILGRIIAAGLEYRSSPNGPVDFKVNKEHGGSIVYWNEPDGHYWEILTVSYARQTKLSLYTEKCKLIPMKSMSLILFCLLCGASSTFSQTQSKLIEWQPKPMGSNNERWTDGTQLFRVLDQVQIESVAVEEPITIGQSFTADDDWLKSIVFRVRNLSGQQLAAIQLTLILPQMDQASPDVIYCYGCAPEEKAKGIAPGETVEVKILRDEYYDFVKSRAVDKGGISQISRAQIREMFVTLRDGTRWVSGCIKTADAKNACRPTAQ